MSTYTSVLRKIEDELGLVKRSCYRESGWWCSILFEAEDED